MGYVSLQEGKCTFPDILDWGVWIQLELVFSWICFEEAEVTAQLSLRLRLFACLAEAEKELLAIKCCVDF